MPSNIDFERFFFNNVSYLCVASLDGYFVEINESFCNFLGFSKEELLSKRFLEFIHPDDVAKSIHELTTLSEGNTTFLFENRYLRSNGQYAHFIWNAEVDQDNGLIYAVASDITSIKQWQDKLKDMNETLEKRVNERTQELYQALDKERELNQLKSRFISIASHEFRTPLTLINSSTDLIKQYLQKGLTQNIDRHTKKIKSAVHHVHRLLDDFLSISKIDEQKIKPIVTKLDIYSIIEDIKEELSSQLTLKQSIVIKSYDCNHFSVNTDIDLLKYILFNLLTNAIKYSDDVIIITISKNGLNIEIKDRGIGIPIAEQTHLFSRFFRASNTIGTEGTGLGLNIVKSYLDLLQGEIDFNSKENEGSTFTLTLKDLA